MTQNSQCLFKEKEDFFFFSPTFPASKTFTLQNERIF